MFTNPVKYKGIFYPVGATILTGFKEEKQILEPTKQVPVSVIPLVPEKVEDDIGLPFTDFDDAPQVEPKVVNIEAEIKLMERENKTILTERAAKLGITFGEEATKKEMIARIVEVLRK